MAEYYIAPKSSFDATADAIRAKTGSQASIEWTEDGFADAIAAIPSVGMTWADLATTPTPSGLVTLTATSVADYAYAYRRNSDWSVNGSSVTYLGQNAFRADNGLKAAYFPLLSSIHATSYLFYDCSALAVLDFGVMATLKGNTITNCAALTALILRKSDAIVSLNATNSFNGTPFKSGGTGGTIYIPKVLYDHLGDGGSYDYKAATNWSTVEEYGTITWAKIEGSPYELS